VAVVGRCLPLLLQLSPAPTPAAAAAPAPGSSKETAPVGTPGAAAGTAREPLSKRRGAAAVEGAAAGTTSGEPAVADSLEPLSELMASILDGLRLDLTVSGPTAVAARQLLEGQLGPALAGELAARFRAGGGGDGRGGGPAVRVGGPARRPRALRALLRLYASAVR
jgi:hypothetical protein